MSSTPAITVLCGGLGGARLAEGFVATGCDSEVTFVTNVADDIEVDGLLVCPDTDAVCYSLAGIFDDERGWGVTDDTFPPRPEPIGSWFSIGVRDRSHHEHRAALLDRGYGLAAATAVLAADLGIRARVLPASDDPVRTVVTAGGNRLGFQEWLVRDHARPRPVAVRYEGAETARPAPGVAEAIVDAGLVVVASSSPVASILPILAVPGVREALLRRSRPTVVLSPVATRLPLVSERDLRRGFARAELLASIGVEHTPPAVAALYVDLADSFVLDPTDEVDAEAVSALGLTPRVLPVTGRTRSDRTCLAAALAADATHAARPRRAHR